MRLFSKTARWNFLIFCRKPSLCSPKNITALVFQGNLKMALFGQNWPKFGLYLANLAGCCNSWKSLKNLKVGVFETDFKQVPFKFRKTTCTYSESWRPVENFLGEGANKWPKNQIWVKNFWSLDGVDGPLDSRWFIHFFWNLVVTYNLGRSRKWSKHIFYLSPFKMIKGD